MSLDTILDFFSTPTMMTLYRILAGLLGILLIMHMVQKYLLIRVSDKHHRFVAQKVITGLGYGVLILRIVFHLTSNKTDVAVAFGVVGAGIAFALQEVIASFAGRLAIMFGDFYKAGDRVQLGGIKGDIIDIGVLRTTVMEIGERVNGDQYNGRVVRVANSFVFKEPVYNYSANVPFLRDEISIVVKYGSDYDQLRMLLRDTATSITEGYIVSYKDARSDMVNKYIIDESRVEPQILIQMMPYRVECTVRYIAPYHERRVTKDKLYKRILAEIPNHPEIILMSSPATTISIPGAAGQHTSN